MRLYVLLTLVAVAYGPSSLIAADAVPKGIVRASWINGGPRVRSSDPRIDAAIADGVARSTSFLNVINEVERNDVIVYVEMQPQLRGRLSGALTWVTKTKQFRYVRVAINPDLSGTMLVAALAHELQHVTEVGRAASIVDTASLSAFYRQNGMSSRAKTDEWETDAARQMGDVVRRELSGATAARGADSIQLTR